jgi:hypothetical protein
MMALMLSNHPYVHVVGPSRRNMMDAPWRHTIIAETQEPAGTPPQIIRGEVSVSPCLKPSIPSLLGGKTHFLRSCQVFASCCDCFCWGCMCMLGHMTLITQRQNWHCMFEEHSCPRYNVCGVAMCTLTGPVSEYEVVDL